MHLSYIGIDSRYQAELVELGRARSYERGRNNVNIGPRPRKKVDTENVVLWGALEVNDGF